MQFKAIFVLSTLSLLSATACSVDTNSMPAAPEPGSDGEIDISIEDTMTPGTEYMAEMVNVSSAPEWQGEAYMYDLDGEKRVYASFEMEQPEDNYFYEGWLVCDGTPYSTGATTSFEGLEENIWVGSIPGNCEKYVLTLEEDDGNPAPAEHLFDGTLVEVEEGEGMGQDFWMSETF
jgi:hypothetical protein